MKILNRKEIEQLENIIEKNYGTKLNLKKYSVLMTGTEQKIWLSSAKNFYFPPSLKINSVGMNFGKLKRSDKIHLTVEGSQIVGEDASKNVVELDKQQAEKFMRGMDVEVENKIDCEYHNFVIVKSGKDILGSGLLTEKRLENSLPKSRRII